MQRRHHVRYTTGAMLIAMGVGLGACGGVDGIELNGSMFDWLGVSPAAQQARKSEPTLADRAPLVVPPDVSRLPAPGSGQPPSLALADDPDARKAREAKERERLHLAYCSGEIQWKERALDPQNTVANSSPYGSCPGLGTFATSVNKQ